MRRIAVLGSTGSIGRQALEVVAAHPEEFAVEVLTAGSDAGTLITQAKEFLPNVVVIADETKYEEVKGALSGIPVKVYTGGDAISQVVQMDEIDLVLAAIVGFAGLRSTVSAVRAGKQIALANKETLVVAGGYVTQLAREHGVNILPVDSEHSAIFQCLAGEYGNAIEKIVLTASGGPFFGKDSVYLRSVRKEDALRHPNWSMGDKITIDSATLMNKGLEVIEARWLFGLMPEQIEVIIHPQSIIHSIVQFTDGSMKAQMGLPDMRLPIQYALSWPGRLPSSFPRFDFTRASPLTFARPDISTFRNLALAFDALERGGNMPCILNAANEAAVAAFLEDRIGFTDITRVIEGCLQKVDFIITPSLEDYFETDKKTRVVANEMMNRPVLRT